MTLQWETVDRTIHDALPAKNKSVVSPEWDDILNELQHTDNAVMFRYADQKERSMLARSVGRRAAHRGFKVDLRQGEDEKGAFMTVTRAAESEPAKKGK